MWKKDRGLHLAKKLLKRHMASSTCPPETGFASSSEREKRTVPLILHPRQKRRSLMRVKSRKTRARRSDNMTRVLCKCVQQIDDVRNCHNVAEFRCDHDPKFCCAGHVMRRHKQPQSDTIGLDRVSSRRGEGKITKVVQLQRLWAYSLLVPLWDFSSNSFHHDKTQALGPVPSIRERSTSSLREIGTRCSFAIFGRRQSVPSRS